MAEVISSFQSLRAGSHVFALLMLPRYLYIVLSEYLHNLGVLSVKSCCTISISASYHIFVWGRYRKSQTCLYVVVGPRLVSTSPAFMRSSAIQPAGPHVRLSQKTVNRFTISGGRSCRHNLHRG